MRSLYRVFFLVLFMMLFSESVSAACPPIRPCKTTAEASTIAGSNADQELITFANNITTSTNQVATALMDMANANAGSLGQSAQNLMSTNAELSQIRLGQELKLQRGMSDREMAFNQELAEVEHRTNSSVVGVDDTKEEFELILKTLSDNNNLSVPEVIIMLQETMDKDAENGVVLVPIASAKGICSVEDVQNEGKCAVAKRVYPGKKLETLFRQCSVDKRMLKLKLKNVQSRVVSADIVNKKTSKALDTTDSAGAVGARLEKQLYLSCSPSQFKANLCDTSSPEEYQKSIVIGNIIPAGDVSASNFSSPGASSAPGYITDLSESAKADLVSQSLARGELDSDPSQRVIPIQHTYRNANQVKASMNYIDNLVADDLASAPSPKDRRKISSASYQSRFFSRVASLSMVRLILTESMSLRVGDDMKKMILDGGFEDTDKFEIAVDSDKNKESVLGAGELDALEDRVNQLSGNVGSQTASAPAKASAIEQINDSLLLQNEMMFKEILMNEQILTLGAISLSQTINSKAALDLMEQLKNGGR
jgi:hypothetical protein